MNVENMYVEDVEKLAPCPQIALDVMHIANESECNMTKLAGKIEQDPSLMASMLKFANSAYFGHMKKINSINDIVVRLGIEAVKLIAIASSSAGLLSKGQEAYGLDTGHLARHSFAVAVLSSIMGRYAKAREIDALFTSALLHDIGKLVLNKPLQQARFDRDEPEGAPPTYIELEHRLLHTDHARVGMLLLRKWGLPDKITVPVGLHHTMDHPRSKYLFCRIIFLANFLTESVGIHSVEPSKFNFDIQAYGELKDEEFPGIPGFEENMEAIMAEFHDKYTELVNTFVL